MLMLMKEKRRKKMLPGQL